MRRNDAEHLESSVTNEVYDTCVVFSLWQSGSSSTQTPLSNRSSCNKKSTLLWKTTISIKKRWELCRCSFSTADTSAPRSFNVGLMFCPQEAERQKKEAEEEQEDEEGWVKVTRGHKGAKARPHSKAANQRTLQREITKKKRKELLNFYTWQHRNTQKERKSLIC